MGEALREKSTDMVGLARPLTAEPAFGTALVAGTTLKAKANEVPSALQTGSSVMQIHDVSHLTHSRIDSSLARSLSSPECSNGALMLLRRRSLLELLSEISQMLLSLPLRRKRSWPENR